MFDVQTTIEQVQGFRVAGVHCGLKKEGKLDFALVVSDVPCTTAAVFTTSEVKAACVQVDMQRLEHAAHQIRAVAINTGSANACTGHAGIQNTHTTAQWVAEAVGCSEDQVLLLSTGVIGMHLPMDKIKQGVTDAGNKLGNNWEAAACAIMTTDTKPKYASIEVTKSNGDRYCIAGITKGAGMIAPNMATMLGVIVTDVAMPVDRAQHTLKSAVDVTYNRITVDGDMSTNDTVLLLANGVSGTALESPEDYAQFQEALTALCRYLAQSIVRDGEGATKFITINVTGALSDVDAQQIANTIANSPLVKTAFFGEDANWGRIMMAAGRAGVSLDADKLSLSIAAGETMDNALQLVRDGLPTDFAETDSTAIVRHESVSILLDCGLGDGAATVWTCDLSHDYVSINADYRT
ncbi:MAG: bifunctional glutamate N-acetyltransferase/amino-acid acetyltransferase ArgJ [Chloroflexi bacterium]|nr:MAG: bifunctional glutamate N-acetyltransferase/amino-acid acetyltransferase ArgJ [Chloroflexota bacterium]